MHARSQANLERMTGSDARVGDLDERTVLAHILDRVGPTDALLGPGDDAAVLAAPGGRIVASVDTLVHGPDFRTAWTDGFSLGWKAAAVNLADIAAMGARPTSLLVALAMPPETTLGEVGAIADGLRAACAELAPGCAVDGGDLAVSDTLTVAVTALGVLEGSGPVTRSGARDGDVLAVSGRLGPAARGLSLLFERFRDGEGRPIPPRTADLTADERGDLDAQLRPRPPIADGRRAAEAGATAMMDVSDGLLLDAARMARASSVTLDIDSAALGGDVSTALTGGEDHALLATFPAGVRLPGSFAAIGRVRDGAAPGVLVDGEEPRGRGGWDPYQDWDRGRG